MKLVTIAFIKDIATLSLLDIINKVIYASIIKLNIEQNIKEYLLKNKRLKIQRRNCSKKRY